MKGNKQISVVGVMSGSSLDGLDIALCTFTSGKSWEFKVTKTASIPYSNTWSKRLKTAPTLSGKALQKLHTDLGVYIGKALQSFIQPLDNKPTATAIHGHTVYHEPKKGYSVQIGCAAQIAAVAQLPIIDQFRQKNIALGGQGAPLVPIGDVHLFPGYDAYLNLGGICNATVVNKKEPIAWDISACNQAFNYLAHEMGLAFDKDGVIALSGKTIPKLLKQLEKLGYYQKPAPKSLSNQWVQSKFIATIANFKADIPDKMHTTQVHLAHKITQELLNHSVKKVLVSGGGAFNGGFMKALNNCSDIQYILPDNEIIEFKEAIIFAYLGALRWMGIPNVLKSYTQAREDCIAGTITL